MDKSRELYEAKYKKIQKLMNGASASSRPDSFGKDYVFPEDLTAMGLKELGQLYSRIGAYRGYTMRLQGIAEIQRALWEDILKLKLPDFLPLVEVEDWMTKTDKKAAAKEVPEALDIRESISDVDKVFKLYFTLTNMYTTQLEILSREISRRKGDS